MTYNNSEFLACYGLSRQLPDSDRPEIVSSGRSNVGKSSLFNALAGVDRGIVTDIPGTTRDTVEESVLVGSTRLRLIDTAGIRQTGDQVEALGIQRSREAIQAADLVIFLCDGSQTLTEEDRQILELCCDAPHAIAVIN